MLNRTKWTKEWKPQIIVRILINYTTVLFFKNCFQGSDYLAFANVQSRIMTTALHFLNFVVHRNDSVNLFITFRNQLRDFVTHKVTVY